jgi:hypothetical protein
MDTFEIALLCLLLAACTPWIFVIHAFISAGGSTKPKPVDLGESPRPDIMATRQWVESMINTKTATCMQVSGAAHIGILQRLSALEALVPKKKHYYILTARTQTNTPMGRLFEGDSFGIALTKPARFFNGLPSIAMLAELEDYAEWVDQANFHYKWNEEHKVAEEYGREFTRQDITEPEAEKILSVAKEIGIIQS